MWRFRLRAMAGPLYKTSGVIDKPRRFDRSCELRPLQGQQNGPTISPPEGRTDSNPSRARVRPSRSPRPVLPDACRGAAAAKAADRRPAPWCRFFIQRFCFSNFSSLSETILKSSASSLIEFTSAIPVRRDSLFQCHTFSHGAPAMALQASKPPRFKGIGIGQGDMSPSG